MGLPRPDFSKFEIIVFEVSEKLWIIHACTYYIDTYSCKFLRENAIVCLHKKRNWKFVFFEQLTSITSVILKKFHFCVCYIQSYFTLKICTSKYQDNIYMHKFIFETLKWHFFCFKKMWPPGPMLHCVFLGRPLSVKQRRIYRLLLSTFQ
jgi:hypothetical protein